MDIEIGIVSSQHIGSQLRWGKLALSVDVMINLNCFP